MTGAEPMNQKLPPPDPNESLGLEPAEETRMAAPTVLFTMSRPSAQADRVADAVLDLRPGLLVVVNSD
jgi:hypothetical protein